MSDARLARMVVCMPTSGTLVWQFKNPQRWIGSPGIDPKQLAQAAQGQQQAFPQRKRDRHLALLRFPPFRPGQNDERSDSHIVRRWQEWRDQPWLRGQRLTWIAGRRSDGTALDSTGGERQGRGDRTQLSARQHLRTDTGAEQEGVGQGDRERLLYQHSWRKERLGLNSAESGSMPEKTGMQGTNVPGRVWLLYGETAQAVSGACRKQLDAGSWQGGRAKQLLSADEKRVYSCSGGFHPIGVPVEKDALQRRQIIEDLLNKPKVDQGGRKWSSGTYHITNTSRHLDGRYTMIIKKGRQGTRNVESRPPTNSWDARQEHLLQGSHDGIDFLTRTNVPDGSRKNLHFVTDLWEELNRLFA